MIIVLNTETKLNFIPIIAIHCAANFIWLIKTDQNLLKSFNYNRIQFNIIKILFKNNERFQPFNKLDKF